MWNSTESSDSHFAGRKELFASLMAYRDKLQAERATLFAGGQGPPPPTPSVAGRFQHARIILHAAQ